MKKGKVKKIKSTAEKNPGFFSRTYSDVWTSLKETRNYFFVILLIFFLSMLLGFYYQPDELGKIILDFFNSVKDQTVGFNFWQMFLYIFNNNIKVSFMGFAFGIILGIAPIVYAMSNGYILGFVIDRVAAVQGGVIILSLFPHGIFEFPAIVISLGFGLRLGMFIFSKNPKEEFLKRIEQGLQVFVFLILPLLILAALIEAALIVF